MLAVDVNNWLRPGAATSPVRLSATPMGGEGPGTDDPGLAVLGDRRPGAGPHVLDRGAGHSSPGQAYPHRPALIDGFLGQTGLSLRTRTTADARPWPFRLCIATTWNRVHPRRPPFRLRRWL